MMTGFSCLGVCVADRCPIGRVCEEFFCGRSVCRVCLMV